MAFTGPDVFENLKLRFFLLLRLPVDLSDLTDWCDVFGGVDEVIWTPCDLVFQRLIETAQWGDDPASIDQQLISHQKFHTTIQRSPEVERAKDDLVGSDCCAVQI